MLSIMIHSLVYIRTLQLDRVSVSLTSHVGSLAGKLNEMKRWQVLYLSLVTVVVIYCAIGVVLWIVILAAVAFTPPNGSEWKSFITIPVSPSLHKPSGRSTLVQGTSICHRVG